jgi:hypothetical protein
MIGLENDAVLAPKTLLEWPLLAESCPSISLFLGDLNDCYW